MGFRIYDEAAGAVRPFEPLVPGEVSIYHCGLTVQSAPHLGHIRKEVVFDVLRRWLQAGGWRVRVVANVTDIDDKILAKSQAQGVEWYELAYTNELALHRAYQALGCLPPNYEPRATGHIPEMVDLVARLVERGHAYAADDGSGDVYFDVKSWPDYGELTRQKPSDMTADEDADLGAPGAPRKRDVHDFALWKGTKPGEPATASWPSPWGRGRPGWHLECSAMAVKYLGAQFDIHGGGIDLRFPHHENELAQARAAGYGFARYWMHNAFVTMAGEKMSKSLGNGAGVAQVVAQFPARAVRLYLAAPHYRSTIDLSGDALAESTAQLARIDAYLTRAGAGDGPAVFSFDALPGAFVEAMDDDLGTPAAVAVLFDTIRAGNKALDAGDGPAAASALAAVRAMLHVLGLDPGDPEWATQAGADASAKTASVLDGVMDLVLDQRAAARERKDWPAADAIRDRLTALGVTVEDGPTGARWSLGAL